MVAFKMSSPAAARARASPFQMKMGSFPERSRDVEMTEL